ncbi:MAG TPA: hypothetical protein VFI31_25205 [Pirellulales bacterium]|nr:hypothetical protein [Pirellulales bacterium]
MNRQLRLIDLVPRRTSTFALLFVGALAVVGALEVLYKVMPALAPMTTDGRVAAFDLEGEGSLAVWFSCATLEAASLTALAAWAIRLRTAGAKPPKILLVAAVCWLVMSIDECGSLHEAFKELMSRGTGHRLHGDGTIWWVIAYAVVLSAVGCRMAWELRRSTGAVTSLFAAGGFYAVAVLAELAWIIPHKGEAEIMLEEGCEMIGNLCLLLSMSLYARRAVQAAETQMSACAARLWRAGGVSLPVMSEFLAMRGANRFNVPPAH